jgi:hypothetical protein
MGLQGLSIVHEKGVTLLRRVAPKPYMDELAQRLLGRLGDGNLISRIFRSYHAGCHIGIFLPLSER